MKNRVTGLGGVFFQSNDPAASRSWYKKHLGITVDDNYGASFVWKTHENPEKSASTVWSPFKKGSNYFEPSQKEIMINFRVENLEELLKELQNEGIEQVGEMQVFDYGKFAWIMDPDGIKIELWEPAEESYEGPAGDNVHKTS